MKFSSLSLAVVAALSFGLSGCGGDSDSDSTPSLSFPSSAEVVEVNSQEAAEEVVEAVFSDNGGEVSGLNNAISTKKVGIVEAVNTLKTLTKESISKLDTYALNETVNETEECYYDGSMTIKGSGSESGYSVEYSFNNCDDGYGVVNGSMRVEGSSSYTDNYDVENSSTKITLLSDYVVTTDYYSLKIYKGSVVEESYTFDWNTYDEEGDTKSSVIIEQGSDKFGSDKLEEHYASIDYDDSYYFKAGKVYTNNLASYLTVDESYDASQTPFNGYDGKAKFIGANSSSITISETGYYDEYLVEVDENNDGIVDNTYTID
jgi:hypothetical protein